MQDYDGNNVIVCNMENVLSMKVHTGDNIVVAPSQTIDNHEYHVLRSAALRATKHVGIVGECKEVLTILVQEIKKLQNQKNLKSKTDWWTQIKEWKKKDSLGFKQIGKNIKPQQAIKSLYNKTKSFDTYITTEVGQHQMWAAQYFGFSKPNHWMTSGGLGTMGYGLPSSVGVQIAHPDSLVIDISGEASFLMNMQELSTIVQYKLPVKIFILNNQWMGMVRQWQELNHGSRYSQSYTSSLPDFNLPLCTP